MTAVQLSRRIQMYFAIACLWFMVAVIDLQVPGLISSEGYVAIVAVLGLHILVAGVSWGLFQVVTYSMQAKIVSPLILIALGATALFFGTILIVD